MYLPKKKGFGFFIIFFRSGKKIQGALGFNDVDFSIYSTFFLWGHVIIWDRSSMKKFNLWWLPGVEFFLIFLLNEVIFFSELTVRVFKKLSPPHIWKSAPLEKKVGKCFSRWSITYHISNLRSHTLIKTSPSHWLPRRTNYWYTHRYPLIYKNKTSLFFRFAQVRKKSR